MPNEGLIPIEKFRQMLDEDIKNRSKYKLDPNLQRDLKHGWMFNTLCYLEGCSWGRWPYWLYIAGTEQLPKWSIPKISFSHGGIACEGQGTKTRKHLEECLKVVSRTCSSWDGYGGQQKLEYFLDWLLYAFGDRSQPELPKEPPGCEGASMRLYQTFNLGFLLAYPFDYFAGLFVDLSVGKGSQFFPTPMVVCEFMQKMMFADQQKNIPKNIPYDSRLLKFLDPCVGTGRMPLVASNEVFLLHGADINPMCVKATMVNFYLYAPWGAKPLKFVQKLADKQDITLKSPAWQCRKAFLDNYDLIDPTERNFRKRVEAISEMLRNLGA